nr:hypothetical protein [Tanacetum cinerariifolium]
QLVVGEKLVKGPKISKGRKRKLAFKTKRNKITVGGSYFFSWIQVPQVTLRLMLERGTHVKDEYPANELLMLEMKKKPMRERYRDYLGNQYAHQVVHEW